MPAVAVPSGEALETATESLAKKVLNSEQVGVINLTAQLAQFICTWSVSGCPVLTDIPNSEGLGPYINNHPMLTYEFVPYFYFMLASSPILGQTYHTNVLAAAALFDLPAATRVVDVKVTKNDGVVNFDFSAVD